MIRKILLLTILLLSANCQWKFDRPYGLRTEIPDGPPEFQAGWHDGCQAGLANSGFLNARMFNRTQAGSGIYQHDPIYQLAYGKALFSCVIQAGNFVAHPSYNMPLEHLDNI